MKTLLRNARILKMDDTPLFEGGIVIDGNKIAYIGNDYAKFGPFDIERDCAGNVLMPGFKNAHTHSAMTFLRSKADNDSLHDWLFNVVFPLEKNLTPEHVYHLCKVAYLEYLSSGITGCLDQYFFPPESAKAAKEMGFRITVQGTFGMGRDNIEECAKLYSKYNDEDGLVRYVYGLHSVYTTSLEEQKAVLDLCKKTGSAFYAHTSETSDEVANSIKSSGLTPIEYFDSLGLYCNGGALFHCVHLTDNDIKILKDNDLVAVICPGSNTKLASGVSNPKMLLENGITVAIGTDGPASNNCLDMFKEMALTFSLSNIKHGEPASLNAYDILKMATVGGAKAMGFKDIDTLNVGEKADIIEIDLHQPNMQPLNNIVDNIVYSGSKSNVKMTMIDGVIRYDSGHYNVGEDIGDIYAKAQEMTRDLELKAEQDKICGGSSN